MSVHHFLFLMSFIAFGAAAVHASNHAVYNENDREMASFTSHQDGFVETVEKEETIVFTQVGSSVNGIRCRFHGTSRPTVHNDGLVVPTGCRHIIETTKEQDLNNSTTIHLLTILLV